MGSALILLALCIAAIGIYQSRQPVVIERECTCGDREKCISKITVEHNGRASRDPDEMFRCGKVKKQIRQLREVFDYE